MSDIGSGIDHGPFDVSGLEPLDVVDGYRAWSAGYDAMLTDTVDGPILRAFLPSLPDRRLRVADLGCGTGRNVLWLREHGVDCVADGADLSEDMLARARDKAAYEELARCDLASTPFERGAYDLALSVFAACHLADLRPLYDEAAALLAPGGALWLVDMHPHMFFSGRGTTVPLGEDRRITIRTYIHLLRDHVRAGHAAGLELADVDETLVPEAWGSKSDNYRALIGHPIGLGLRWRRR